MAGYADIRQLRLKRCALFNSGSGQAELEGAMPDPRTRSGANQGCWAPLFHAPPAER